MTATYRYNIVDTVRRLQHWMDSIAGQTFLNYAYSWGASVVILGALFKLTHLPGADFFLFLGMGTEVVVFFISAFDRPFVRMDASTPSRAADTITAAQQQVNSAVMEASLQYSERLEALALQLNTVQQMLTKTLPGSEEIVSFEKRLAAINEVYGMLLEKASQQMPTIDDIRMQMQLMDDQLSQLNTIYASLLEAMRTKRE